MKRIFNLLLGLVALSASLNQNLHARWGTSDDASAQIIKNDATIKIKKDGTYTYRVDQYIKILNEEARQNFATQMFSFDKSRVDMKLLEAETIIDDIKYPVSKDKIEIKPLASDDRGLRKDYQLLVPFQNVVVGSVVHIAYEKTQTHADMPDYYASNISFDSHGTGILWENYNLTIESELPLETKVNDPTKSLKVSADKKKITVQMTKPLIRVLVAEPDSNFLDSDQQTYVNISTEKDYKRIGAYFGKLYEAVVNQPLPEKLEQIRQKAAQEKNDVDMINTAVVGLIENIHYLGNWDTAGGHLIPRDLKTISDTGYGDCKEYASCLAAILRKLGFDASPALVSRDTIYIDPKRLPSIGFGDHIIVRAVNKSGKVFWVDPTNTTAMADGIFPDISNRPALMFNPKNPVMEQIPEVDYKHASSARKETITFAPNNTLIRSGNIQIKGERAEPFIRNLFSSPESMTEDYITKILSNGQEPKSKKLSLPKITDRRVHDIKVGYELEEQNTLLHTNGGRGFMLESSWAGPYIETAENQEGTSILTLPGTLERDLIFNAMKADNLETLNYKVTSPWLNAERNVTMTPDGIELKEKMEFLKKTITPEEIRTPEFQALKNTLKIQCRDVALILSPPKE